MPHQAISFQCPAGVHVKALHRLRKRWDDGLDLAVEATTPDSDVDVQQAGVLGNDERNEDSLPLHGHEERLKQRLSVDMDNTSAWLDNNDSPGLLPLAVAMRLHLRVDHGTSFLHGYVPSEVE